MCIEPHRFQNVVCKNGVNIWYRHTPLHFAYTVVSLLILFLNRLMAKQIASFVKKIFYVMLNGFIFTIFYIQQLSSLHTQQ